MTVYALAIAVEESAEFRWVLLEVDGETAKPSRRSDDGFASYHAALQAGAAALAEAAGQGGNGGGWPWTRTESVLLD